MSTLRDARLVVFGALLWVAASSCVDPAALQGFECHDGVCTTADGGLIGGDAGASDAGGCNPSTCSGCCRGTACVTGDVDLACGTGGVACLECLGSEVCVAGTCTVPDAGAPDAGPRDGGTTDAGSVDAGGSFDAGKPDAGTFDAGSPDAGVDAGTCAPAGSSCAIKSCCAGAACVASVCVVPSSGTCAQPTPLIFGTDGGASVTGTTVSRADTLSTKCDPALAGPDVVYSFTTTVARSFTASLTSTAAPPFSANLELIGPGCGPDAGVDTCGAYQTVLPSSGAFISDPNLPAGTWYLVVDTSTGIPFTLQAGLAPTPFITIGDLCALPAPMTVGAPTRVSTETSADDVSTAWCSDTGPDRVYSVTQNTPGSLTVNVTPTSPSRYAPNVAVYPSGCNANALTYCRGAAGGGQPASLTTGILPSGTYDVVVDGLGNTSGESIVEVEQHSGETCADPIPIPSGRLFRTRGTLANAANDAQTMCGLTSACGDAVYRFTLPAPSTVWATMAMVSNNQSALGVRSAVTDGGVCTSTPSLGCGSGYEANLGPLPLPAGTYDLWADCASSPGTSYDLTVSLDGSPIPGDTCADAIPVDLTPAAVRVEGSVVGAAPNFNFPCVGTQGDVFYKLTIPRGGNLTVTLTPFNPTASLALDLVQNPFVCPGTGGNCINGTSFAQMVSPGTAYLVVGAKNQRSSTSYTLNFALP